MTKIKVTIDLDQWPWRQAMRSYCDARDFAEGVGHDPAEPPLSEVLVSENDPDFAEIAAPEPAPTTEPGRIPEGFMSGPAGTLVPETPPAPEPNWDDLVALVQAGASIKDVAAAARIDGRKLSGRVQGARNKKMVAEPAEPCVAPPLPGPPLFLEIDPGDVIPHPDAVAARAAHTEAEPVNVWDNITAESFTSLTTAMEESAEPVPESGAAAVTPPEGSAEALDPEDEEFDLGAAARGIDTPDAHGWTLREDITLIERYTMGEKSYAISRRLKGRTPVDVVRRFKHMLPHPTFDGQNKLLAQLRAIAAKA